MLIGYFMHQAEHLLGPACIRWCVEECEVGSRAMRRGGVSSYTTDLWRRQQLPR
jgi:hypothetical protein